MNTVAGAKPSFKEQMLQAREEAIVTAVNTGANSLAKDNASTPPTADPAPKFKNSRAT